MKHGITQLGKLARDITWIFLISSTRVKTLLTQAIFAQTWSKHKAINIQKSDNRVGRLTLRFRLKQHERSTITCFYSFFMEVNKIPPWFRVSMHSKPFLNVSHLKLPVAYAVCLFLCKTSVFVGINILRQQILSLTLFQVVTFCNFGLLIVYELFFF